MNWDILGHEWAVNLLQGQVALGETRHAYLFTGPQGIGRRTLAIRLAQALNCPTPAAPGVPCLTCRTCRRFALQQHPDLSIVQAQEGSTVIRVDQIRELQRSLSLAPYEARYRIALIRRLEESHPAAANALLKTLEEPAPNVILLLTAESSERLLETIVSRCEVIRLRPLSPALVAGGLIHRLGVAADTANRLAHLAGGRYGQAVYLHQNPDQVDLIENWLEDLFRLLSSGRIDRFHYAETASRDRLSLRPLVTAWLSLWRDVFLIASGAQVPLTNLPHTPDTRTLASLVGLHTARRLVVRLEELQQQLDQNVNPRLALEVFMLDLPEVRVTRSAPLRG